MIKYICFLAGTALLVGACNRNHDPETAATAKRAPETSPGSTQAAFIGIDSANKMIGSYLESIHATANDTDVRSFIIDAAALSAYLAADSGAITNVKVMLAHKLDSINQGFRNRNCGYDSKGLTVVISGYDASGNYVYMPGSLVLNHAMMCPPACHVTGNASKDLLHE